MTAVNPYFNFNGNTEEAFNFFKSVFGGEFQAFMRFKDNPGCGPIPEAEQDRIMHVALPIGNGNVLMATERWNLWESLPSETTCTLPCLRIPEKKRSGCSMDSLPAGK